MNFDFLNDHAPGDESSQDSVLVQAIETTKRQLETRVPAKPAAAENKTASKRKPRS